MEGNSARLALSRLLDCCLATFQQVSVRMAGAEAHPGPASPGSPWRASPCRRCCDWHAWMLGFQQGRCATRLPRCLPAEIRKHFRQAAIQLRGLIAAEEGAPLRLSDPSCRLGDIITPVPSVRPARDGAKRQRYVVGQLGLVMELKVTGC